LDFSILESSLFYLWFSPGTPNYVTNGFLALSERERVYMQNMEHLHAYDASELNEKVED